MAGPSRLHFVPIVLFFYLPTSFLLCYAIALSLNHINWVYAFISDAGTVPPEQYIFAQLVNMGAALFAYFIYIRYVQVEEYMKLRYNQVTPIANTIAVAFGFTSSLGMSLVGNFPELRLKEIHLFGAFLAFVSGSIYVIFQGYFTLKLLPHFQSKAIAYIRIYLGVLGLMLYFGAHVAVILAYQRVTNRAKLEYNEPALKWREEDGGYMYRAASVIMEWLLIFIFDIFIITFVPEFKKFKLDAPRVQFFVDVTVGNLDPEISSMGDDDMMPIEIVSMDSEQQLPMSASHVIVIEDFNSAPSVRYIQSSTNT